ncbi:formyltetrahydrofolate deformylase [Azospirillum brasilense]|jgi:formyltetrahydrofolate deformylase|uniref:Formyltetrahydrofolate deformylase n=1 Tax=Azospirillum brasilense TaxID=192 RepID=A0A0N7I8I7_AZOBR|nr:MULTISPECIES: formyltetrahydrofolate deformylase [Azospirillum]ALJ37403.1 formyltetrahydrofolate deformylase [Azospirillum brasilense]MDW7552144.1 formyltetrahydrofolate deformylase [Azospirillum brasilense]MDW7591579.1 formyltetrahydrofolate deformylase [Azospirillum brasilense]MDW7626749.1 formyltetrahydrofolate deformylase [Azospirillum brasilense]MDX5950902.1 formyltetrahydrofolate deformylase [Azospirillum brasilense]
MSGTGSEYILTVSCPDAVGIVYAVSGFLAERSCNIIDSAQFGDRGTNLFFLRIHFSAAAAGPSQAELQAAFAEQVAERFGMTWKLHDAGRRQRVLIMVSKFGHCLNDLLYRYRTGYLPIEIPAIVSNHRDFYQLAAWHNIPFHYLPLTSDTKAQQEARLLEIAEQEKIDLVVLARYMQVLSPALCERMAGRVINIHHSFLPSFKGAKPYHQAHARGVKLIGATAHYVTSNLDEGPIIEQEAERVDHTMTPDDLVAIGRDIENIVLARAVRYHVEHRVLLNGGRTVVFK